MRALCWITCLCLLATAVAARSQSAGESQPSGEYRPISDFHHTAWTSDDGSPGDTWAIAQTPDGWLWLGGPRGLFRFDGVQFEPVPFSGRDVNKSNAVYTLLAEDSGELWIGFVYGGVTRLFNGSMQHFDAAALAASVTAMSRDTQGRLWAATSRALVQFDGQRWQRVGVGQGFGDAYAVSLQVDGNGTVWVAGSEHMHRMRRGELRFERTSIKRNGVVDFLFCADGRLWYDDESGIHLLPEQDAVGPRPARANSRRPHGPVFDRDGHVWRSSEKGLMRIRVPPGARELIVEKSEFTLFGAADGLTDSSVHSLFEDREGNIWTVSGGGLDRFRHTNVRRFVFEDGADGSLALAAAAGGPLWIGRGRGDYNPGDGGKGLWRFDGRLQAAAPFIQHVSAAETDGAGGLWVGGSQGLWRRQTNGEFRKLPELPEASRGRLVHALTVDGAGDPWVSMVQAAPALFRLRAGKWETQGGLTELPSERPQVHTRDPKGRIWFGYRDNRVALVDSERVTLYGAEQGLQLGMINAIHVGRFTILAGERAIALLQDGRFHTLTSLDDPAALEGVTGIAETSDGDLWFNGFRGAARIAAGDLDKAARNAHYVVPTEVFDSQDGFPGIAQRVRPLPTLVRDGAGRLWFAGTLGLAWLQPEKVRRNSIVPPVRITSITSADTRHAVASHIELHKGAHDLQIDYTALSFTRPERIRFRYRFEGYDETWVEAGSRRQAFYTNLTPGNYRFQVVAANENGVWNESGASVSFTIPPAFVQSGSFLVLCVLSGMLLIWGFVVLRLKQLTARERGRLEERLGERERIARELHDTLLQGVQGLILRLQTTVDQVDVPGGSRAAMNDALDRADALLIEGRDRVKDLRSIGTESQTLKQALLDAAKHLSDQHARLRIIENGTPRELHPIVREETARIAIEAMLNSLRHSEAKSIEVELSYERRALRVSVKDDGLGMDASVLSEGREGHFGFMGMKERANRIRAQLGIWSRPGAGTEVNLIVPARMAYVRVGWKKSLTRIVNRPSRG